MNPYLKDIGLQESVCSCQTSIKDNSREERFQEQRKRFGFDERETWALDYTAAEWLYSHLRMYMEKAGNIVDLSHYAFSVPILETPNYTETPWMVGEDYFRIIYKTLTQEEAILLCLDYLKAFLLSEQESLDLESSYEKLCVEQMAMEKGKCAFHIFAILLTSMWW